MTYEQITKANESIKTTDIKGKDYAEVNQRIKAFRMVEPDGAIIPEIVSLENGVCVMKVTILDANRRILAVGHAYEKEDSTFINKTSYIENCETSAVGRALGMCGFGIDTSIASYEEVVNAVENQKPKKQDKKTVTIEDLPEPPPEQQSIPLTLHEAENMQLPVDGGVILLKNLRVGQLEKLLQNESMKKYHEAAMLILNFKANQDVEGKN